MDTGSATQIPGSSHSSTFIQPLHNSLQNATKSEDSHEATWNEGNDAFHRAKLFTLNVTRPSKISLYSHLLEVIYNMIEKPENSELIENFEQMSWRLKMTRMCKRDDNALVDVKDTSQVTLQSRKTICFFGNHHHLPEAVNEAQKVQTNFQKNLIKTLHCFELIGISLPNEERFLLKLSIDRLMSSVKIINVRFWGKILGTINNYYIVEAEESEGAEETENLFLNSPKPSNTSIIAASLEDTITDDADKTPVPPTSADYKEPDDPIPQPKDVIEIPQESNRSGVNKKIYFASNSPCGCWTQLPNATPRQIQCARKIRKFFTGQLSHPVITYPPFEGNESVYLRAQIARISATTIISPLGYYTTAEHDEDDDELTSQTVLENEDFEPVSIGELASGSLEGWCHHMHYLLPQGRCYYWRPPAPVHRSTSDYEEMDDEEDESGPPILTAISEDSMLDDGVAPWSVRVSSALVAAHSFCSLHSNRWPGAAAFSDGRTFANLYIGWGVKAEPNGFSPSSPPRRDECFPPLADINHASDPSAATEAAHQSQLEEQQAEQEEEEEGEEFYEDDSDEEEEED